MRIYLLHVLGYIAFITVTWPESVSVKYSFACIYGSGHNGGLVPEGIHVSPDYVYLPLIYTSLRNPGIMAYMNI